MWSRFRSVSPSPYCRFCSSCFCVASPVRLDMTSPIMFLDCLLAGVRCCLMCRIELIRSMVRCRMSGPIVLVLQKSLYILWFFVLLGWLNSYRIGRILFTFSCSRLGSSMSCLVSIRKELTLMATSVTLEVSASVATMRVMRRITVAVRLNRLLFLLVVVSVSSCLWRCRLLSD